MSDHDTEALDASNVFQRLWVGSAPPTDRELGTFTLIALCAREYQPERVSWRGRVTRMPLLDDVPSRDDIHAAVVGARQVATELQRGGTVLVTCQVGRNRSAWVAAMAMLIVAPKMTPVEAMVMIRQRRSPTCLSNPHFVQVLHRIWGSRMQAKSAT